MPDAEAFRREQERMIREHAEWPQRLERLCREAEVRWRAAHPWLADPNMCVSVPVPRLDLADPQAPRSE
jgi:hypothetical protein